MSIVELRVGSMRSLEWAERDWRGDRVPDDQVTEYWLNIPFPVVGKEPGKEFTLTTTVTAKIPLRGLPKDRRQAQETVLELTAAKLAVDFSSRHLWRTFGEEDIDLDQITPADDVIDRGLAEMPPVSVQAPPELYERLGTDAATMKRVNSAYSKAKERLFGLTSERRRYELSDCEQEISSLLYFIEACNRCSADSWMAAWYKEKTPRVKRAFEDLARRKNVSHPNYELAIANARTIYDFNAPYAYRETPPSPHQVEEFLNL